MLALVSTGDDNVDVLDGLVSVNEGNGGEVDVRGLNQSLSISVSVSDNQKAGLHELLLDLIGEGTGGEATRDGLDTSEVGELEDGPLSELTSGDDGDILGLVDGDDHASGEHQLLPGLLEVDNVTTWWGKGREGKGRGGGEGEERVKEGGEEGRRGGEGEEEKERKEGEERRREEGKGKERKGGEERKGEERRGEERRGEERRGEERRRREEERRGGDWWIDLVMVRREGSRGGRKYKKRKGKEMRKNQNIVNKK